MKRYTTVYFISLLFCLFLNGTLTYAQANSTSTNKVVVLPINIQVPANAKKLATIKLGNNSTQVHCAYDDMVVEAKEKAAAIGGNIVKIKELIAPYFISKCYKIEADIFYAADLPQYDIKEEKSDMVSKLDDTDKYALLYIYRLSDTVTFQPGYDLFMNDSLIYHIKSRSRAAIKIYQEGSATFTAKAEKTSVSINISFGHIYFLRCGTIMGSIRQIPYLEQIPYDAGISEYKKLIKTQKDLDISYLNQVH